MSSSRIVRPTRNGVYRIKVHTNEECFELQSDNSVKIVAVNSSSTKQLWNITSTATTTTYNVASFDGNLVLTFQSDNFLVCKDAAPTEWMIDSVNGGFSELSTPDKKDLYVDRDDSSKKAKLNAKASPGTYQRWVFNPKQTPDAEFQHRYFTLTAEEAAKEEYDIIIIGSGFGGGVLAADLFETNHKVGPPRAKKILLVERGDLVFHTHCLNAARPIGDRTGRDQFNHSFYSKFKDDYNVKDRSDWGGGPVYGVGGRGTIWSLAAPRIHDETLKNYFPETVATALKEGYYQRAERLLRLFLPRTRPEHQEYMDRLNLTADGKLDVAWQWARIASEFGEQTNFDFAQGAYSPTDNLLEIAMSEQQGTEPEDHKRFKIVLGTEARKIVWDSNDAKRPTGIVVKTVEDNSVTLRLVQNADVDKAGRVVMAAGSVHSPAILLRSGVDLTSGTKGGLHLTDHTILFVNKRYRYKNPRDRADIGSMKLQTYLNLLPKDGGAGLTPHAGENATDLTLVNLYIDSSPFLWRGESSISSNDISTFVMIFVMRTTLETANTITCASDSEPVVTIQRSTFEKDKYDQKVKEMVEFTKKAMSVTEDVLKVEFVDPEETDPTKYFQHLALGAGGHEMGSIPMPTRTSSAAGCLDDNLLLRDYKNVYVCDLSAFPFVPEANPSLTLTGLSLRLSDLLVPRLLSGTSGKIAVVNHSGAKVQVAVSLHDADGKLSVNQPVELGPGARAEFPTYNDMAETVFVYKLDLAVETTPPTYLSTPEWFVGRPNGVTAIPQ